MQLQAISRGCLFPPDNFSGYVHSIFDHACNVLNKEGQLLTLLTAEKPNYPQGLRLGTSAQFSFLDYVKPGQMVACRGGVLRFKAASLTVDSRPAQRWQIDLSQDKLDLDRTACQKAWGLVREEIIKNNTVVMKSRTLTLTSNPSPIKGARSRSASTTLYHHLTPYLGLGPGLTPAGDDFVIGYLAGLWSGLNHQPQRRILLQDLGQHLVETATAKTTLISQSFLKNASLGYFAEPLANLAQAIQQGWPLPQVRQVLNQALAVGHSSGPAGVCGLVQGLKFWATANSSFLIHHS